MFSKLYRLIRRVKFRCFLHKMRFLGANIDKSVSIYGYFTFDGALENLTILEGASINQGVHFELRESILIGKGVSLSSGVRLHTSKLIDTKNKKHIGAPISIGHYAWIASGALITAGVKIGEESIVAGNSVVIRDIPPRAVVGGSPAISLR